MSGWSLRLLTLLIILAQAREPSLPGGIKNVRSIILSGDRFQTVGLSVLKEFRKSFVILSLLRNPSSSSSSFSLVTSGCSESGGSSMGVGSSIASLGISHGSSQGSEGEAFVSSIENGLELRSIVGNSSSSPCFDLM